MKPVSQVLITGGAGYVGSVLIPKLLNQGHRVKVLDLYIYGTNSLKEVSNHPNLEQIKGDIRDRSLLERIMPGTDAVIHLACISNDPSFELDPELGKSINYDAFPVLVDVAKDSGVKRFVYASSSSVYGLKEDEDVTEDLPPSTIAERQYDHQLPGGMEPAQDGGERFGHQARDDGQRRSKGELVALSLQHRRERRQRHRADAAQHLEQPRELVGSPPRRHRDRPVRVRDAAVRQQSDRIRVLERPAGDGGCDHNALLEQLRHEPLPRVLHRVDVKRDEEMLRGRGLVHA